MQPDGSYLRPEPTGEAFVSQTYLHTYFAGRHRAKARSLRPVSATEKAAVVAAAVELAEKQLTEFKLWDLTGAKKRV